MYEYDQMRSNINADLNEHDRRILDSFLREGERYRSRSAAPVRRSRNELFTYPLTDLIESEQKSLREVQEGLRQVSINLQRLQRRQNSGSRRSSSHNRTHIRSRPTPQTMLIVDDLANLQRRHSRTNPIYGVINPVLTEEDLRRSEAFLKSELRPRTRPTMIVDDPELQRLIRIQRLASGEYADDDTLLHLQEDYRHNRPSRRADFLEPQFQAGLRNRVLENIRPDRYTAGYFDDDTLLHLDDPRYPRTHSQHAHISTRQRQIRNRIERELQNAYR